MCKLRKTCETFTESELQKCLTEALSNPKYCWVRKLNAFSHDGQLTKASDLKFNLLKLRSKYQSLKKETNVGAPFSWTLWNRDVDKFLKKGSDLNLE